MGYAKVYQYTKFEVYSYTVPNLRMGVQNLASGPTPRPFWEYFVIHAKIYQCTKFEVSNFTRSKFMEGPTILKLGNVTTTMLHFPHIFCGVHCLPPTYQISCL